MAVYRERTINLTSINETELKYHELLGYGASGEVYRVTWKSKHRGEIEAAAKKIPIVSGQTNIEEFANDIGRLQRLKHPNIIEYYGYVVTPNHVIVVTEYAPKGSLFDYLKKTDVIPQYLKEQWAIEVTEGIKYLKDNHIQNLDIKSPNILITADNRLKICDFGIAKKLSRTRTDTSEKGSIKWQAPEIFTDEVLSPEADVFALGVVLWELETCQEPYEGESPEHVMLIVGRHNARPEIPETCPLTFQYLMERCWEKSPSNRPTIDVVLQLLKQPSSPSKLSFSRIKSSEAIVVWSQSDHTGGSPFIEYTVKCDPEPTTFALSSDRRAATLKGLKPGTKYVVRICAKNIHGVGNRSTSREFTTKVETNYASLSTYAHKEEKPKAQHRLEDDAEGKSSLSDESENINKDERTRQDTTNIPGYGAKAEIQLRNTQNQHMYENVPDFKLPNTTDSKTANTCLSADSGKEDTKPSVSVNPDQKKNSQSQYQHITPTQKSDSNSVDEIKHDKEKEVSDAAFQQEVALRDLELQRLQNRRLKSIERKDEIKHDKGKEVSDAAFQQEATLLERERWYHGALSRQEAEKKLLERKEGTYLVRISESGGVNKFVLSVRCSTSVLNIKFILQQEGFMLHENDKPDSISGIISHYVNHALENTQGNREVMALRYPLCRDRQNRIRDRFYRHVMKNVNQYLWTPRNCILK